MHAIMYWGVVKIIKTGWVAGWVAAIEKPNTYDYIVRGKKDL